MTREVLELTADGKVRTVKKKRSKYGNKRVQYGDLWFDSHAELKDWIALKMRERAGEIRYLDRQVSLPLTVNGMLVTTLIIDFSYEEKSRGPSPWVQVFHDTKGGTATQTPEFRIKQKLLKAIHGIDIRLTGKGVK